jgi:two-component system cell cycle sensor histidine kinase/response regulator CckA
VLGEQIVLRTDIAPDLWPVRLDPAQLEQVIVNLAVNARDAMKDGGKLLFEARNVMLDEAFLSVHADIQPGPFVLLSVSDSGHGIPAEVLPHIFEPFFTTKPVGVGSGLGLATVYGIVRQSQGYIWVYSEPGVGTTFKIYFPRSELSLTSPEPPAAPRTDHGTERILVVEDEESVRRMLVRALESAGYRVHSEPTPAAALAWAKAQGGAFDLLITDVVMPEMSGKQLAEFVTASFPRVRVLFISGYTENTIVHRGVLDEGVDFVAKPFSLPELRAKLREVLER